jgi:hypothetical protein
MMRGTLDTTAQPIQSDVGAAGLAQKGLMPLQLVSRLVP